MTMKKSRKLNVRVGAERIVLTDGLQPFMFRSRRGTIFLQSQLTAPPGFKAVAVNVIPRDGIGGNVISRDNGRTWQRWHPKAWSKRQPYFEGAYTQLRDGTILLMEWIAGMTKHPGKFEARLWESADDLKTLRGPIIAPVDLPQAKAGGYDDGGRPYSGVTFHRTILELPHGDLLAAVYCWFKEDETPCPYQPRMCKFRCVALRSSDRGHHWRYASTIAVDPKTGEEGFDEPVMIRLSRGPRAGRLICLMRTGSIDCPIHQVDSDDEGRTWSRPRPLAFHGVDPDLVEMSDGTLACSFGWRTERWTEARPPAKHGNYVIFSRDQGRTWAGLTR
ncbi:MAG: hypothetical protein A2269_01340, partial [Lentisphaerae bacterium RIFOXYA12_FULL_60_10]